MLTRLLKILLVLVPLASLVACAGNAPLPPRLSWPEAPRLARIQSIGEIARPGDLAPEASALETLLIWLGVSEAAPGRYLVHPADVDLSPDGRKLYVSDFAQGVIHVFDRETGETSYLGERPRLRRPFGIAVDAAGNVYVAEQEPRHVRVLSPTGETLRILTSEALVRPIDVELDEARGRLYVADGSHQKSPDHYVHVFDLEGGAHERIGLGKGSGDGHLLFPTYLAVGPQGNLYVSDTMNARIAVFDPQGDFLRAIGTRGDGFGNFDKPKGVAFDGFGNLYVVDSSWSIVQIFGPEDDVLLYFGGRGAYPGLLSNPTGIAIDADHNIFVADYLNRRLAIYQLVNTAPEDGVAPSPLEDST